jgi:hypothetical protein
MYSDQLRQRLVRMSVRHHEQLFSHQQRQFQLTQSLTECAKALEDSVQLLKMRDPSNAANIPSSIIDTAKKYSDLANSSEAALRSIMAFETAPMGVPR